MLLEKISEEELDFAETISHPIACSEILFDDCDNLASFSEDKYGYIRKYQIPFLGFDTLFFEDKKLTKKENFNIKKGLGDGYDLGGRTTGKTKFGLVVDVLNSMFHKTFNWGAVESCDEDHVKNPMEQIVTALEFHPIMKLLDTYKNTQRKPYHIVANNGCKLESVNDNLRGNNPGGHWFAKHCDKIWAEEASFITKEVTHKKINAISELGCVEKFSGMTTFPKVSPMGEVFYNIKNKNKIVNLPSYVNPNYDEHKDSENVLEFGGRESPGYKVQIRGEIVETGDSVFDIERIRETYIKDKFQNYMPIKSFEVNKNNFYRYKDILILDRPSNSERLGIYLDVGEGAAPTEIIVVTKTNGICKYIYNISTFKLSPEEEKELLKYIIEELKANIVGIDVTSGGGKALFSYLQSFYPENIHAVSFNENIDIDFEKDEKNNYIYDNSGRPKLKQERVDIWSFQCLKKIFYNRKIQCYFDMKLDQQFDGIIVTKSKQGKTLFGCKVANHLFQAFQVFAITEFLTEFKEINPVSKLKKSFGAFLNV